MTNDVRERILVDLTDAQRSAVTHIDGPLLVLAGAGSGKTRVITRRVAWLMANGVSGSDILAVTFTNKAANEMKQRIDTLLTEQDDGWGSRPTVATFHSFSARVLRIHHDRANLPADFTIYDQSDRLRAIKRAIEKIGLSPDNFTPEGIEQTISRAKNQLQSAEEFSATAGNFIDRRTGDIYRSYETVLAEAGALDFDDLLYRLARLLRDNAEFRTELARRYRYMLIDEYQDTNAAQYQIAHDLVRPANNLCATGDPDQSIYGWRGANIDNILRFERDFPGATVVRLEQNYRSTQRILAAADGLIRNNLKRKHKGLWTENPEGEKIAVVRCLNPEAEAEFVADRVEEAFKAGGTSYSQMAIFMRLNALTRTMETAFRRRSIPYQIARGVSFFSRKEIKDATSYLRLLANPADRVALERVINCPPRGIGQTTVQRLIEFADKSNLDLWQAVRKAVGGQDPAAAPALGRSGAAVKKFVDLIDQLNEETRQSPGVLRAVELVLRQSGLTEHYKGDENASANLGELVTAAGQFDQETDFSATLNDWLCEVALVCDVDAIDPELGAVTMMTLHAAKGLEFPLVFIVGCESGIIPLEREGRVSDIEEERRLLFVGITRTMRKLTLTHVADRMLHGKTIQPVASPFVSEIPADVLDQQDLVGPDFQPAPQAPAWSRWRPTSSSGSSSASSGASGGFGWRKKPADDDGIDRAANKFDAPSREFSREDAAALRQAEQESTKNRTGWPVGTLVRHPKFGIGKVIRVTPSGPYTKATIDFRAGGLKAVILEMAKVERLLG